jgi:hypothetical protein
LSEDDEKIVRTMGTSEPVAMGEMVSSVADFINEQYSKGWWWWR